MLNLLATIVVILVALLHCYFLILEMFLWEKPAGLKTFKMTAEEAASTRVLAANQGLYNGFLAAGLISGLLLGEGGSTLILFALCCVVVAGCYGAATAHRKILWIQAAPAALALGLLLV
ncbi:MAG: DUF1304 domain-containing protein [Pseudomonadota bacterium]